ncbi:MAG: SRPBCC family protein [Haloferacaceae archaeon]
MSVYRRRTRVAAPLEEVWSFHSRIEGVEALTPEWMGLSVDAVRGPEGEPNPEVLEAGSRIRMSMQPFGAGPRQRWVSHVTERERREGRAWFVDRMEGGPFRSWEHTHLFFADGDGTVVEDRVEYELPFGDVGRALAPFARVGFEPMFRYRHRRTREILEG